MDSDIFTKIQNEMSACLFALGIYPNTVGFSNVINTVICVVKSGNPAYPTCKAYKDASAILHKTPSSIERSIREIIIKCENNNTASKLNAFFGCTVYHGIPLCAGELISLFAMKYINEINFA